MISHESEGCHALFPDPNSEKGRIQYHICYIWPFCNSLTKLVINVKKADRRLECQVVKIFMGKVFMRVKNSMEKILRVMIELKQGFLEYCVPKRGLGTRKNKLCVFADNLAFFARNIMGLSPFDKLRVTDSPYLR